jgi:hypothetical protein
MMYAVEMGSHAMMYILSFIKTGSSIRKLIRWDMQTAGCSRKPIFYFKVKAIS